MGSFHCVVVCLGESFREIESRSAFDETYRRVTGVSEIHQLSDARNVRNEFTKRRGFMLSAVDYVRRAVVVLTADKSPSIHLEMRKNRRRQNAAKLE